jgi:hypothetical protein
MIIHLKTPTGESEHYFRDVAEFTEMILTSEKHLAYLRSELGRLDMDADDGWAFEHCLEAFVALLRGRLVSVQP